MMFSPKRRAAKLSSSIEITHVRPAFPLEPRVRNGDDDVTANIQLVTSGFMLQDRACKDALRRHFHIELDRILDELYSKAV